MRNINRITGITKKSVSMIQSNEHSDFCVCYGNAIQRIIQAIFKDQNHHLHVQFHRRY